MMPKSAALCIIGTIIPRPSLFKYSRVPKFGKETFLSLIVCLYS